MAASSVARQRGAKAKVVPINGLDMSSAISDIDRLAAYCRAAILVIQDAGWESETAGVDVIYLLDSALIVAGFIREQIDPDSPESGGQHA